MAQSSAADVSLQGFWFPGALLSQKLNRLGAPRAIISLAPPAPSWFHLHLSRFLRSSSSKEGRNREGLEFDAWKTFTRISHGTEGNKWQHWPILRTQFLNEKHEDLGFGIENKIRTENKKIGQQQVTGSLTWIQCYPPQPGLFNNLLIK